MAVGNRFMSNYFDLFNIKPTYSLNPDELELKYLQLQKQFHPDNYSDIQQQLNAINKTVELNDAYKVLSHQSSLIQYYLEQKGLKLSENDIKDEISNQDLMFLLDSQEHNNIQAIRQKSSSIISSLIEAIEQQNQKNIRHYLALMLFYSKSLKHI